MNMFVKVGYLLLAGYSLCYAQRLPEQRRCWNREYLFLYGTACYRICRNSGKYGRKKNGLVQQHMNDWRAGV